MVRSGMQREPLALFEVGLEPGVVRSVVVRLGIVRGPTAQGEKMQAKRGDLVVTPDGYYGIVTSDDTVALSNGCEAVLEPDEFKRLTTLPLKRPVGGIQDSHSVANFIELVEGRLVTQPRL